MQKFLLWDHDGVLVDTEKWYFEATRQSLATIGIEIDQQMYLVKMAEGLNYWETAKERGIPEAVVVETRNQRNRLYQEYLLTKEIAIEGVMEVLSALRNEYRMAIVTTSRREDFDLIHRSRRMREHFEFVINIEDCVRGKPDPDPYQRALRRFNAAPSDAVAIEDSSRGLRSAVAAGIDCVVIHNEFTATQNFAGAWRKVRSVRELPAVLQERELTISRM